MLCAWVMRQPQYSEGWQPGEVGHLLQISYKVLSQEYLLNLATVGEVFESRNSIVRQRYNF